MNASSSQKCCILQRRHPRNEREIVAHCQCQFYVKQLFPSAICDYSLSQNILQLSRSCTNQRGA